MTRYPKLALVAIVLAIDISILVLLGFDDEKSFREIFYLTVGLFVQSIVIYVAFQIRSTLK